MNLDSRNVKVDTEESVHVPSTCLSIYFSFPFSSFLLLQRLWVAHFGCSVVLARGHALGCGARYHSVARIALGTWNSAKYGPDGLKPARQAVYHRTTPSALL